MINPDILPIDLSTRLTLDSVSYSNCLPEWIDFIEIDYAARRDRISELVEAYSMEAVPKRAFQLMVPKKTGGFNRWLLPSINDQIIIQSCVSAISSEIEHSCINFSNVFSCRLNNEPSRVSFLENQIEAWKIFQLHAEEKAKQGHSTLQIDIKGAFNAIRYENFIKFLKDRSSNSNVIDLLDKILRGVVDNVLGIPFINDSIFFLGNAYFSNVDLILSGMGLDFIRYVDDYKIFSNSRSELEKILLEINRKLASFGLEVNEEKLYMGDSEEYLESLARIKYQGAASSEYIDAAVQPDLIKPEDLFAQILSTLRNPDDFLHQGFGRLQMASLRRMRTRRIFTDSLGYGDSADENFGGMLSEDPEALRLISVLLRRYSQQPDQSWRLVWLLYLSRSLGGLSDRANANRAYGEVFGAISEVAGSAEVAQVARLWAGAALGNWSTKAGAINLEELHDMDYLSGGGKLFGG
jgi:hypothetical protein